MRIFAVSLMLLSFISCNSQTMKLEVVKNVEINKYLGKWYEIARFPHKFEKDLKCVSAEYTLKENGKIAVLNKGYSIKKPGIYKIASGTAWIPNSNETGKLKVRFFWPFAGNYWILELDENYSYALIGDESRNYLWILSRTKEMNEDIYNKLVDSAKEKGFDVSLLSKVEQNCQ